MDAKAASSKKERKERTGEIKTETKTVSFNLFKESKSVAEIAKERNLSITTIEGHLAWFVGSGEIDITKLVSMEKQLLIVQAAKAHGFQSHKTIKENLPDTISYGEIRLVLAGQKTA